MDDYIQCIYNLHTATTLNLGPELPFLLRSLGTAFADAGFSERSQYYYQEALNLDGDSVYTYLNLAGIERYSENYEDAVSTLEKGYSIDSNNIRILGSLGLDYLYLGQYEESLIYFKKYVERLEELGDRDLADMAEIGYVYWQNGYKKEADYYYNEQISYCLQMNELGRYYSHLYFSNHDLATVYAARGEKEKAYENLRIFNQRDRMPGWAVMNLKYLPLF
jgi:tetratricopeptide (TPR) repeat protein